VVDAVNAVSGQPLAQLRVDGGMTGNGKCPVFCVGMSRKETHVHDNQKRFGRAP
jgi:hypothetical protein